MATIPGEAERADEWSEVINGRLAHVRRFVPTTPQEPAADREGLRRALAGELPGVIVRYHTWDGRLIEGGTHHD